MAKPTEQETEGNGRSGRDDRTEFFTRAQEYTPYLATPGGGALFLVKTSDMGVGRSLFAKQGRGEHMVLARAVGTLRGLMGPEAIAGRTFIDVGANIGTTTVPAVVTHGFGSAVSIEPEPENIRNLRLNIVLNDLDDRVTALPVAVSNERGEADLVVNQRRTGKHWIATDRGKLENKGVPEDEILRVETVTLDYLVEGSVIEPERVGMLWMDAEAHEGHVLEGASALLERGTPIVLEYNPELLDRAGGLTKIDDALRGNYTHFAGMHRNADTDKPDFPLQPVDELPAYAERFLDPDQRGGKTDIIVLRLEIEQAAEIDNLEPIFRGARSGDGDEDAAA